MGATTAVQLRHHGPIDQLVLEVNAEHAGRCRNNRARPRGEDELLPHLDGWLSGKFDPIALASTVRELEEAAQPDPPTREQENAERDVAECDAKLRQHCAALEAAADPVRITSWMKETHAKRAAAEARLTKPLTAAR